MCEGQTYLCNSGHHGQESIFHRRFLEILLCKNIVQFRFWNRHKHHFQNMDCHFLQGMLKKHKDKLYGSLTREWNNLKDKTLQYRNNLCQKIQDSILVPSNNIGVLSQRKSHDTIEIISDKNHKMFFSIPWRTTGCKLGNPRYHHCTFTGVSQTVLQPRKYEPNAEYIQSSFPCNEIVFIYCACSTLVNFTGLKNTDLFSRWGANNCLTPIVDRFKSPATSARNTKTFQQLYFPYFTTDTTKQMLKLYLPRIWNHWRIA